MRWSKILLFVSDKTSKGIWLYLPIGISLIINGVMFTIMLKKVMNLSKKEKELGLKDKENMQR